MTPPPKCCGNCKWFGMVNGHPFGYCSSPTWPCIEAYMTIVRWPEQDGTDCPCHTPADRIERIEGR